MCPTFLTMIVRTRGRRMNVMRKISNETVSYKFRDSNPRPLVCESSPITTRPGLLCLQFYFTVEAFRYLDLLLPLT